jgi:hypothetical protein
MLFENIIRYLEGEAGDAKYMENEANKEMREMYERAKEAIKELDKNENKI